MSEPANPAEGNDFGRIAKPLRADFFPLTGAARLSAIERELRRRDGLHHNIKTPDDYRQAFNEGMESACRCLLTLPRSLLALKKEDIQNLHRRLYQRLYKDAGHWRNPTQPVIFGGYIGADANAIETELDLLEGQQRQLVARQANQSPSVEKLADKLRFVAFNHARLALIHPFRDGNGRLVRLISLWQETWLFDSFDPRVAQPRDSYIEALKALPGDLRPLCNYFALRNQLPFLVTSDPMEAPFPVHVTIR